jgi:hypothetical protein
VTAVTEDNEVLGTKDGMLASAGVLAALGVAVFAWRKGLAGDNGALSRLQHDRGVDEKSIIRKRSPQSGSLLAASLESASHSLLPLAEAGAEEVGRWTAKNAPDLIRDRLLPRFIDAFNAAA